MGKQTERRRGRAKRDRKDPSEADIRTSVPGGLISTASSSANSAGDEDGPDVIVTVEWTGAEFSFHGLHKTRWQDFLLDLAVRIQREEDDRYHERERQRRATSTEESPGRRLERLRTDGNPDVYVLDACNFPSVVYFNHLTLPEDVQIRNDFQPAYVDPDTAGPRKLLAGEVLRKVFGVVVRLSREQIAKKISRPRRPDLGVEVQLRDVYKVLDENGEPQKRTGITSAVCAHPNGVPVSDVEFFKDLDSRFARSLVPPTLFTLRDDEDGGAIRFPTASGRTSAVHLRKSMEQLVLSGGKRTTKRWIASLPQLGEEVATIYRDAYGELQRYRWFNSDKNFADTGDLFKTELHWFWKTILKISAMPSVILEILYWMPDAFVRGLGQIQDPPSWAGFLFMPKEFVEVRGSDSEWESDEDEDQTSNQKRYVGISRQGCCYLQSWHRCISSQASSH